MEKLTSFAKNLRDAREAKGLRQNELAEKVGVTPQTISAYEKGGGEKGKNPTLENALAIAVALNISLDKLCGRDVEYGSSSFNKSLRDVTKDIVFLADVPNVAFSTITETKTVYEYDTSTGYPDAEDIQVEYPTIIIRDDKIARFLKDWRKIRDLFERNTIDKELYDLWMDKHINYVSDEAAIPLPLDWDTIKKVDEDGSLPF